MAVDQDTLQTLKTESAEPAPVDLSWLDLDQTWGISAKGGKRGLTLDEVNIGPYGPPSDDSPQELTYRARGAAKREGVPRMSSYAGSKANVWSENATLLYDRRTSQSRSRRSRRTTAGDKLKSVGPANLAPRTSLIGYKYASGGIKKLARCALNSGHSH